MPSLTPLQRHAALQPLSREHMNGLIQARDLVRAAATADLSVQRRAVEAFLDAWRDEIAQHFDDEERLLLPLTTNTSLAQRLIDEHDALRRLAARLADDPESAAADADLLARLGRALHDHIRWEERIYFESIQRDHPDALAAIHHEAVAIEKRRPGARPRRRLDEPNDTCPPSRGDADHPQTDG